MARLYVYDDDEPGFRVRAEKGYGGSKRQVYLVGSIPKAQVQDRQKEVARLLSEAVGTGRIEKNTADELAEGGNK